MSKDVEYSDVQDSLLLLKDVIEIKKEDVENFLEHPVWQVIQRQAAVNLNTLYGLLKSPNTSGSLIRAIQGRIEAQEWILGGPERVLAWVKQEDYHRRITQNQTSDEKEEIESLLREAESLNETE
jgi:hypothetical protein